MKYCQIYHSNECYNVNVLNLGMRARKGRRKLLASRQSLLTSIPAKTSIFKVWEWFHWIPHQKLLNISVCAKCAEGFHIAMVCEPKSGFAIVQRLVLGSVLPWPCSHIFRRSSKASQATSSPGRMRKSTSLWILLIRRY